jgi:hypothetical protein
LNRSIRPGGGSVKARLRLPPSTGANPGKNLRYRKVT